MAINILVKWQSGPRRSLLRIMPGSSCSWHDELFPILSGVGKAARSAYRNRFGGFLEPSAASASRRPVHRPVAFILAGEMAVAYFQFHAPAGFWPLVNKGELAALYCFLWLYFSAAGPGPWSLDALLGRRPRNS